MPRSDSSTAGLHNHADKPQGAVPRKTQQYIILGVATLIVLIALFSGHGEAKSQAASQTPGAPDPTAPNAAEISAYEQQLQQLQNAARGGAPLPGLASNGASLREQQLAMQGALRTQPSDPPAPQPNPIKQQQQARAYDSLFASNIALTYRANEATDDVPTANVSAQTPAAATALDPQLQQVLAAEAAPLVAPSKPNSTPAPTASPAPAKPQPVASAVPPKGSYVLAEGTILPTVLLNRLTGDFAGSVECMVSSNVYSADRQQMLIPAGSKVLGEARQVAGFGQRRLAVVFHRLLLPNGASFSLDTAQGLDQGGATGLTRVLVQPWLNYARSELTRLEGISRFQLLPGALSPVVERLGQRLFQVALPVGAIESVLAPAKARMGSHGRPPHNLAGLYRQYAVLTRTLAEYTCQCLAATAETLEHLADDWSAVTRAFFAERPPTRLVLIQPGLGDPHRAGRSVTRMDFDNGARLVYKPRCLKGDEVFGDFCRWLNCEGLPEPLRPVAVLDMTSHGWAEWVSPEAPSGPDEERSFYFACGELLAVLFVLLGSDAHFENLLQCRRNPVFVDVEGLFDRRWDPARGRSVLDSAYGQTLLAVGLLPGAPFADSIGAEASGIFATCGAALPYTFLVPSGDGVARRPLRLPAAAMPAQAVAPDKFCDEIISGFGKAAETIVRRRRDITLKQFWERFASVPVRQMVRATVLYAQILLESYHPNLMRDAVDRDALFDRLWLWHEEGPAFIASCRRDLWAGDIPYFSSYPGCTYVLDSTGRRRFRRDGPTPIHSATARIERLNTDVMRHKWGIRCSLEAASGRSVGEGVALSVPHSDLARTIADKLTNLLFLRGGQAFTIDAIERSRGSRTIHFAGVPGSDFYAGLAGMLFFLHYFCTTDPTSTPRHRRAANALLKTLIFALPTTDGSRYVLGIAGSGSVLYALAHITDTKPTRQIIVAADRAMDTIEAALRSEDAHDMISGNAGTICCLLAWHRSGNSRALELARLAGDKLIAAAVPADGGVGWASTVLPQPITGFAHGADGIAYALMRLAKVTNECKYLDVALAAIRFSRAKFIPALGNWPDERQWAAGPDTKSWCYGAPGIGLARAAQLRLGFGKSETLNEIRAAFQTTLRSQPRVANLCHGSTGINCALAGMATAMEDPEALQAAERYRLHSWEYFRKHGLSYDAGTETLNLMLGLAGIGYSFLAAAHPQMPSVLLLEAPHDSSRGGVQ